MSSAASDLHFMSFTFSPSFFHLHWSIETFQMSESIEPVQRTRGVNHNQEWAICQGNSTLSFIKLCRHNTPAKTAVPHFKNHGIERCKYSLFSVSHSEQHFSRFGKINYTSACNLLKKNGHLNHVGGLTKVSF